MPRPSFSRKILPAVAIVGIIGSAIYIFSTRPDQSLTEPGQTPAKAPAEQMQTGSIAGTGVIEPSSEVVDIATQIPGVVSRLYVNPGEQVSAGQPLLEIDSRDARAAVSEAAARLEAARASIAAAQTGLKVAQNQYALYQRIDDPRAVSQQEVIQRRDTVADARAQVTLASAQARQAQAQLNQAHVALAQHIVRAPAAMEVLQVGVREGEYAGTGGSATVLMRLGATRPLHIRLDVDENQIARLAIGEPAIISPRGDARRQVKASYVRTEPLVIPKRSLTNGATERVDVRVLQLIYAMPEGTPGFFVGQQVDGFVPAKKAAK